MHMPGHMFMHMPGHISVCIHVWKYAWDTYLDTSAHTCLYDVVARQWCPHWSVSFCMHMPARTCTGYTHFLQLNRWPMFHSFAGPRECRSSSNAAHEGGDGTGLVRCHPRSQRAQHHARLADIHRVRHIPQCSSAATCRAPVVLQSFGDKKRFEEKALPPLSCGIRAEACAAIAATYIGKLDGLLRQVADHSEFSPSMLPSWKVSSRAWKTCFYFTTLYSHDRVDFERLLIPQP